MSDSEAGRDAEVMAEDRPDRQLCVVRSGDLEMPARWEDWDLAHHGVRRGYQLLDPASGVAISEELPQTWVRAGVAVSSIPDVSSYPHLQRSDFSPGKPLRLISEAQGTDEEDTVGVWSADGRYQLGHLPRELAVDLDQRGGEPPSAMVLIEFAEQADGNHRVGVRMLLGPGPTSVQSGIPPRLLPWPPPTLTPMAVVHAALDAQGEVRFGVWLGTATSLEGLYRAEAQASSLPWAEVRHPPYLDYKRDDEPEYDTSGWPACTEVGTWADWVRWTIWKQPGYLDVWIEVEPEPTVQELFAREFAGREAGPVIRLTEVERP